MENFSSLETFKSPFKKVAENLFRKLGRNIKNLGFIIILFVSATAFALYAADQMPPTGREAGPIQSHLVRVAIGKNDLKEYEHDKAFIYATGKLEVCCDSFHAEYPAGESVKVVMQDTNFILADSKDQIQQKFTNPICFHAKSGYLGIKDLKRKGKATLYRGNFRICRSQKSEKFVIVNYVELEDYLRSVVPCEMRPSFGLEALKAQCIAARNYACMPREKISDDYELYDSVQSQAYFGVNHEHPLSAQAVSETEGIVVLHKGKVVTLLYSSTPGGFTEKWENTFLDSQTQEFPSSPDPIHLGVTDVAGIERLDSDERARDFYCSRPDSFDQDSPYFRWNISWTEPELRAVINHNILRSDLSDRITPQTKIDDETEKIVKLTVLKRGISGKAMFLEILTNRKRYIVRTELGIRKLLSHGKRFLPSANIILDHQYDQAGRLAKLTVFGGGFGHGVGMSQYGAGFMASKLGKNCFDILQYYYRNVSFCTIPVTVTHTAKESPVSIRFYSPSGKGVLVLKYSAQSFRMNFTINEKTLNAEFDGSQTTCCIDCSTFLHPGVNIVSCRAPKELPQNVFCKFYIQLDEETMPVTHGKLTY